MTATGQVPRRAVRHPMSVVTEARRLAAGDWKDAEIIRLFESRGVRVSKSTVGRWVRVDRQRQWERDLERAHAARAAVRGARPMGYPLARPEYKLARIAELRRLRMSFMAIAALMRFDFGDEITANQVRHALKVGRYPKVRSTS